MHARPWSFKITDQSKYFKTLGSYFKVQCLKSSLDGRTVTARSFYGGGGGGSLALVSSSHQSSESAVSSCCDVVDPLIIERQDLSSHP